ncbi:MAG: transporter substrate-binding domain-containing protein [Clostridiales bacterium]|nr:transporter substrate-binding domain-containing protein [Clostridiales bacterium]
MNIKKVTAVLLSAVALSSTFSLAACSDDNGAELIGFDVELAKAVAVELGVKVDFQLIEWSNKEMELNGKTIDLIWNGLTITDERRAEMEIGTPYMNNKQVAVIRKADKGKFTTFDNIKSANFSFEKGSAGQDVAEERGYAKTVALNAQVDALTDVKAGASDIAILDSVLANFYCNSDASFSDLMIIPDLDFTVEQYGIAARKGDVGTIDKINTALYALQSSGELNRIAEKYGLKSELCDVTYESKWDTLTDVQKSGWKYIEDKGTVVIGYTLYAPIAYKE